MADTKLPELPFAKPSIDEETIAGVADVIRSGWITSGPMVKRFEAQLETLFGRPVLAYNSGTCTMEIALRLADIGPGHEVITSPLSWVATANVILAVGATPVFVDVDPVTRNLDLNHVAGAVTARTRAILPVYLAGAPVDMDELYRIAARHRLRVIEDAAQAIGSRWQSKLIGSFGDFCSFSFQANKNITCAEGGALVLPDTTYIERAQKLRLQGLVRTGFDDMEVDMIGGKFNMTDIAARIGIGQLARLAEFTEKRLALVTHYFERLSQLTSNRDLVISDYPVLPPGTLFDGRAIGNWHLFQLVLPLDRMAGNRADFMANMKALGISTGVHYPAIHLFKLYREHGWAVGQLPHAEHIGKAIVTLPLFPSMSIEDVDRVCDGVQACL